MKDIPLGFLLAALVVLLLLSGFFSGSETGLMTLNRYRLRHMAKAGNRGARLALKLLKRPDRLIGIILLGNNLVNILASSLVTLIALQLGGEGTVAVAAFILTFVVLIFSEVAPKTLAALHPERIAYPAAFVMAGLLKVFYPVVWVINTIANGLLRPFGVSAKETAPHNLSREELRTIVNEAGAMIPRRHQKMLTNIIDLEKATVEDIMVPRNEIVGVDLEDDWDVILEQLTHSQHTRLPVYRGSIDDVQGLLHLRKVMKDMRREDFGREHLVDAMREAYFIPEGTSLHTQLLNFQRKRRRIGMVVDEYGDIMGLVTLEDILEEIVGEFTTDPSSNVRELEARDDGSYLAQGSISVRELNRALKWKLPTDGPKTLNGLILEYMETIPEPGTSLMLQGYPVTVLQTKKNKVKMVEIPPQSIPKNRKEGGETG